MRSLVTTYPKAEGPCQEEPEHPDDPGPAGAQVRPEDPELVSALAAGHEQAFTDLVNRYHRPLVRQALAYVANEAVAEEVVQETWLAVMEGIKRFEGRSSLKTWLYQILIHKAKTAGIKESRQVPLSSVGSPEDEADEADLESRLAEMAQGSGVVPWRSGWTEEPSPEEELIAEECRREIARAIEALPPVQRQVLELSHFKGASSEEVCRRLRITETNKHVLLHRGRRQVRKVVDRYFAGDRRGAPTVRRVYELGLAA